ncbi:glycosyltransferase family 4 protein [Candidatus Saccharibacteria bacterium]|nr:MAG: glycosyltransferase family 4 protein [Candidatus Saccharibacteria bacterium]
MKVLYVTRKFPPTVGGMENVAAWLYEQLATRATVKLIKFGGANKYLPVVFPWLVLRAVFTGWIFRPDIIYVQDGLMGAATPIFRALLRRPVVATIHGTEMVYKNPLYVKTVIPALGHLNAVGVISRATEELVNAKLPGIPTQVIHWGAKDEFYRVGDQEQIRRTLESEIGVDIVGKPVIYLAGRMTERKGARWFVENVMPPLKQQIPELVCLIAGQGKDYEATKEAIERLELSDSVHLLGYVHGEKRALLYNAANLFIMPNRSGYGFEGFGMVAVEVTSCGTPAVVGEFAGTVDAVIDNKTGWLVPVDDAKAYLEKIVSEIKNPSLDRANVRAATLAAYDWDKTADMYLTLFDNTIEASRNK